MFIKQRWNTKKVNPWLVVQDDKQIKCGDNCFKDAKHPSCIDRQSLPKRFSGEDNIVSLKILHISWMVHKHHADSILTWKWISILVDSQQFLKISAIKLY